METETSCVSGFSKGGKSINKSLGGKTANCRHHNLQKENVAIGIQRFTVYLCRCVTFAKNLTDGSK
jgi:hypothetical protein